MLKINKPFTRSLFIFIFLVLFFFLNLYEQEPKNILLDQNSTVYSDYILDEIDPYCKSISYKDSKKLTLINLERININFIDKSSWYQNLMSAYKEDQDIIYDKFKKRFFAQIIFLFSDGKVCEANAKIRISGDWKDHIDLNSLTSSMDVSLEDSNIESITKFKLFLPETKRSETEFITTQIMRKLNFLVPKTSSVLVSINNQPTKSFIFQEKIVKEFLESNNFREGPLIETSEELFWENRNRDEEKPVLFSKILNTNWAIRTKSNIEISKNALNGYNNLIFLSPNDYLHYQKNYEQFEKLQEFDTAMYALDGHHGLAVHNRKFYFNKIENKYFPIYYDADSQIAERDLLFGKCDINNKNSGYEVYRCINNFNEAASSLLKKINFDSQDIYTDLQNQNLSIDEGIVIDIFDKFIFNLNQLSKIENYSLDIEKDSIKSIQSKNSKSSLNKNFGFYFFNFERSEYTICNLDLSDCNVIDFQKSFDFKSIDFNSKKYFYIGSSLESFGTDLQASDSLQISEGVYLQIFGSKNFSASIQKGKIDLVLNNDQKVLFYGEGKFEDYEISVQNNLSSQNQNERQDENLLTGCLTIYNLHLDNIRIFSENSKCEDSVNFINVSGYLENITIINSANDGLDIDFSNLEIEDVNISNSGNDCLDISFSKIVIFGSDLINCTDKGVSIGENSTVLFNKIHTALSGVGITIKDSSNVEIEEFSSDENNICVAMYRKKQEFGPSYLLVKNYKCNSEIDNFIQAGQEFINNEN